MNDVNKENAEHTPTYEVGQVNVNQQIPLSSTCVNAMEVDAHYSTPTSSSITQRLPLTNISNQTPHVSTEKRIRKMDYVNKEMFFILQPLDLSHLSSGCVNDIVLEAQYSTSISSSITQKMPMTNIANQPPADIMFIAAQKSSKSIGPKISKVNAKQSIIPPDKAR